MRDEGTFGEVTVFCYAQGITDGTTQGQDFRFDPKVLYYVCTVVLICLINYYWKQQYF